MQIQFFIFCKEISFRNAEGTRRSIKFDRFLNYILDWLMERLRMSKSLISFSIKLDFKLRTILPFLAYRSVVKTTTRLLETGEKL